jgi:hypothetical protein
MKKCPDCGKEMYFDADAGPIVGGFVMMGIPNAHPVGAWICLNPKCPFKEKVKDK